MKSYLDLAPVPLNIECEQLGPQYNPEKARAECNRMRDLLLKKFPPPGNAVIVIRSNSHDFGSYLSVEAKFEEDSEEEVNWAYNLENSIPLTWED